MTIFVTWQLIGTLDSICNSCDVYSMALSTFQNIFNIKLGWADELPWHYHSAKPVSSLDQVVGCLPGGALLLPFLHYVETRRRGGAESTKSKHLLLCSNDDCCKMEVTPWNGHLASSCYLSGTQIQNFGAADLISIDSACNNDLFPKLGTPWQPCSPRPEWWPPGCVLPAIITCWTGNGSIKFTDVMVMDCKKAFGWDADRAGFIHIHRESRSLLPLHCPCSQKLTGPPASSWSSNNEHSNVEAGSGTPRSCHCQASHPAPIPTLVDWVEHQTGGSVTASFNGTTTGCNQGGWSGCHKCNGIVSTRRQSWWGTVVCARVHFGRKAWATVVASCHEDKAVLDRSSWVFFKLT